LPLCVRIRSLKASDGRPAARIADAAA
jgi:hypothetical protein